MHLNGHARVCTSDTDAPSTVSSKVAVYVSDKKLAEMNTLYADFHTRNVIKPTVCHRGDYGNICK